jgi:hypothetical protein
MSKKLTFNLIDIYTDINTFISQMILVVNEMLDEDYILPTEFGVYIFTPIWRRFKNSNACFENSEEGIASFKDNFTNQIQEIGFDFFSWCKANIEYFKTITDETNKNKSFSKQLNTGIYPVNENLQQTATQTQFATGTTNQNIVEIISNGIGWYKASQQFMTPQKKNDMLNSFKWLFIKYSNATKNEYTVLEIDKTGLIPVGDADYVEIVDDNLKSENIKTGVEILGIEGSAPLPKVEQSKSFTVTQNRILNIYPDEGKVLNEVVVDVAVPPTPTEEKTVNITDNGTTVVTPTFGSNLSKVTVNVNVSAPLPKVEQSKSFTVTQNRILNIYPDEGKVLNEVVVDVAVPPTPTEEKTVNITDNGTTVVTPTFGSNLSKVTVNVNVSTPLDDPNLTFQTVLSTNNMILRVDTYNSDIQTRMLYLYKIRIGYTISPTSTSTDINNRLADLYVCIAFDETESIMKISCIPVKNVSSEGSITIVSTSNDITISNYLANLTFFTATSSRGYARSVNLNNVELIYTKKL